MANEGQTETEPGFPQHALKKFKAGGYMAKPPTGWTDTMILDSIKQGHGLTEPAKERAFELAAAGFIDMSGTWKLTELWEQRYQYPWRGPLV